MRRANFRRTGCSAMTARTIALLLLGPNAAKQLQFELPCTSSQAWRIVSHAHVPSSLRGSFWHAMERKAERLLVQVEAARDRARAERMALRDRRLGAAAGAAEGPDGARTVLKD